MTVINDSGPIARAELSTPDLAFANAVWTYMTSHIVVHPYFTIMISPTQTPQGIYPALVVIMVNSQKSYIDGTRISPKRAALLTQTSHTQSGSHTAVSSQRPYWATSDGLGSRPKKAELMSPEDHVLNIEVHELREVHNDTTFDDVGMASINDTLQASQFLVDAKSAPDDHSA